MRCCISMEAASRLSGKNPRFRVPMPCSPDSVPPNSEAASNISRAAFCTRSISSGSRRLHRMFGVKVAVPYVPEQRDRQVVTESDLLHAPHHCRDLGAGHRNVLAQLIGLEPGKSRRDRAASLP